MSKEVSRYGTIAIFGKPNVGKSTLLNALVGQKVSITASKPQTTRERIVGIKTVGSIQAVFIDTPGILNSNKKTKLARSIHHQAVSVLFDAPDVIIFMLDALVFTGEDEVVLSLLKKTKRPVILVINKVDKLPQKEHLLPFLAVLSKYGPFAEMIPLSARDKTNLDALEKSIYARLPEGAHLYQEDVVTDRSVRFLAGEFIREKVVRFLHQELPTATAVELERFKEDDNRCSLDAVILVEKPGQKPIVIGEKGQRLKEIGRRARLDMENLLGKKVYLRLWVKQKPNWTNDLNILRQLGYMT